MEVTRWLISANKTFDTIRAFNELKTLDWDQGKYKLQKGDLVYIYLAAPIKKVRLKCKVVDSNMDHSEIDDRKYITGLTEVEKAALQVGQYGYNTMRLTVLAEYVESDIFGIDALAKHGVLGSIRTPRKITGETLKYFEEIDVKDNILKSFKGNKVVINKQLSNKESRLIDDKHIGENNVLGSEKEVITKVRVNQSKFRQKLIRRYGKCVLCGMDVKDLLIASHIKPWSESSGKEKTSVDNGLLLCPNHDKLFDQGYIAFENDGSILISSLISKDNYKLLGINNKMKIKVSKESKPFIEYHRKNKHIW